jgi:hypothetical protein
MTITFLQVCLLLFAGCAGLGIVPASVLAAKAHRPGPAMAALLTAAFVVFVLIAAAEDLGRH